MNFLKKKIININKILWKIKKIEIFSDNFKDRKLIDFENKNDQLFSILKNYKLYELLNKSLLKNKFFKKIISSKEKKLI